jgi:hypothetical protein
MKRILALLLALLMVTLVAVSCDTKEPTPETTDAVTTAEPETEAPTEAPTEEPTEAPTEEPTEAPTEEGDVTVPPAEETSEEWTEPEDVPYTAIDIPIISGVKDKTPHGYNASGEFSFEYGDAVSVTDNNMFIVTNDRLPKGKITATFQAPDQHNNDNGIVFGMIDDEYEQYYFWEDGPTYYFLFVSDDANLYLAKVSDNGAPWTELQIVPIPNYKHGDTVTISVEFDGEGFIDCYANEEWLISYYDENWSGGARYGIRCEVPDVCYTNVTVDHDWEAEW